MSGPDATPALLEAARSTLREAVLPAVAAERRYEAAMVANALGIAARELRDGASAREAERRDLAGLVPGAPAAAPLAELRALFRDAVRAGALPADAEPRVREALRAGARRRLAISNPDHLVKREG